MRVAFIGDSDSQLYAIISLCEGFLNSLIKVDVDIYLDANNSYPATVIAKIENLGLPVRWFCWPFFDKKIIQEYQAVGVYLTGSKLYAFLREARQQASSLPYLFCGFNGISYEKFEEGMAWRLGYDCICVNGPKDVSLFEECFKDSEYARQHLHPIGVRDLRVRQINSKKLTKKAIFAEQVAVPKTKNDRRYLYALIKDLATKNSEWKIIIKPRLLSSENTFHKSVLPLRDIYEKDKLKIDNLVVDDRPLSEQLEEADVLMTVSSTAVFDAISYGVTPCVLTDFGVNNSYGTHYFFGSGIQCCLDFDSDLEKIAQIKPKLDWLEYVSANRLNGCEKLLEKISAHHKSKYKFTQIEFLSSMNTVKKHSVEFIDLYIDLEFLCSKCTVLTAEKKSLIASATVLSKSICKFENELLLLKVFVRLAGFSLAKKYFKDTSVFNSVNRYTRFSIYLKLRIYSLLLGISGKRI